MKKMTKIATATALSAGLLFGGLGIGLPTLVAKQNQQLRTNLSTRDAGLGTKIVGNSSRVDVSFADFKKKLQINSNFIQGTEFFKEVTTITNGVDGAKYILWTGAGDYHYDGGTGIVKWAIWTRNYRNANGDTLTDGTNNNLASRFYIESLINTEISKVELKANYPKTLTPYEWYNNVVGNASTTNWMGDQSIPVSRLADYYTLENLPKTDAIITKAFMPGSEKIVNTLTFILKINRNISKVGEIEDTMIPVSLTLKS